MKIIVFYDNFTRDYRSTLLLCSILKKMGNKAYLLPLWNNAIEKIKKIQPDTVVMGQVGEFATSQIGGFCHKHGINLVINTAEIVNYQDRLKTFFSFNFKESNAKYIDLQTIPNSDFENFVKNNISSNLQHKYKFVGFPRFDLSINKNFTNTEVEQIKKKYNLEAKKTIFLYISSFIYDQKGGQVSEENQDVINEKLLFKKEHIIKKHHIDILYKLLDNYLSDNQVLLIKKHPWDKSDYFETKFNHKKCIILEKNEYVVPLIAISDFILHAESTVALEAWIQNKKTISMLPDYDEKRNFLMNHMKYETIIKNYNELINVIENYPGKSPGSQYLKTFSPFLDGKSTIRFAHKINKLKPKENQTIFPKEKIFTFYKLKTLIKKILFHFISQKKDPSGNYINHFLQIEKGKKHITKLYYPIIKKYLKENKELIN